MNTRQSEGAARGVAVVVAAIVVIAAAATVWSFWDAGPPAEGVELEAESAEVRYGGGGNPDTLLPPANVSTLAQGDAIDVNTVGRAELRFADYLWVHIFRDSGLSVESSIDPDAPPLAVYHLRAGTTFNTMTPAGAAERRLRITAGEVVITALGTEFLVHHDPSSGATWVVVREGTVSVSAMGREVIVRAGQQSWVEAGGPPADPRPATREETGERFPLVDDLTNGNMHDDDVLIPTSGTTEGTIASTDEPTTEPTPTSSSEPTTESTSRLPDLVVSYFDHDGPARSDAEGVLVPAVLEIANRGGAPAEPFKVAIQVEARGRAAAPVPFRVSGQEDAWFPFAGPLPPGETLQLRGEILVPPEWYDAEGARLVAEADSTVGDEFVPEYGRVQESDEGNNRSKPLEIP